MITADTTLEIWFALAWGDVDEATVTGTVTDTPTCSAPPYSEYQFYWIFDLMLFPFRV